MPRKEEKSSENQFDEIMSSEHLFRNVSCNIFIFTKKVNIKCSDQCLQHP